MMLDCSVIFLLMMNWIGPLLDMPAKLMVTNCPTLT